MIEIAKKIIFAAVEQKTPCIVDFKKDGIALSPRDGLYENNQILGLYMSNYNDINGVTGLRMYKEGSEKIDWDTTLGNIFITWSEIRSIGISQDKFSKRYYLNLDGLTINFLKEIKDLEL